MLLKPAVSKKDGLAPIYARIALNGQRSEISLGMRIDHHIWNQENGRIKGTSHENLLMNSKITQAKANLEKHFFILTTQFGYVTADMVSPPDANSMLTVRCYCLSTI